MKKSLLPITAGGIVILAIILTLILIPYQESDLESIEDKEIQGIEKIQIESDYKPLPKEWITSGPFQIDRSKYAIGEKIFISAHELKFDEKGQITIVRLLNATHQFVLDVIPFDGAQKSDFNFYFTPALTINGKICSVDDIIGKWSLIFTGTDYPNLDFEIDTRVVPGTNTEPVC